MGGFHRIMGAPLTFEVWRELLRKDCAALDKIHAFDSLGYHALRLLYDCGIDPTVQT